MTRFVVGDDRSQSTLFPERLKNYLAEDNPVRAIDLFVDELDPRWPKCSGGWRRSTREHSQLPLTANSADRQGEAVPEAKITQLNEKIATLRGETPGKSRFLGISQNVFVGLGKRFRPGTSLKKRRRRFEIHGPGGVLVSNWATQFPAVYLEQCLC